MAGDERYLFGSFTLDIAQRVLLNDAEVVPLPPKAVDALVVLVENAGRIVGREELRRRLWPGVFVSDNTLYQKIWLLRKAVESGAGPVIKTYAGNGYRFVAQLRRDAGASGARISGMWLFIGQTKFPLVGGENKLGRDAECEVVVDLATVSRRHARISAAASGALLEDCGSKNGTFVNERLVSAPVRLEHGDVVRLGEVRLVFRVSGRRLTTKTFA